MPEHGRQRSTYCLANLASDSVDYGTQADDGVLIMHGDFLDRIDVIDDLFPSNDYPLQAVRSRNSFRGNTARNAQNR